MDNLNGNTKEKFEREIKVNPWRRYNDSLNRYEGILDTCWIVNESEYRPKRTETEELVKYMSHLDFDILKRRAIEMYEGKAEFNKKWFLRLFEILLNDEIFEILHHEDSLNLCNDKNFILELMEHSGAVLEIASFAGKDAIMQIFEDKELLGKIYNKEILTSSNLEGYEIISVLLLQLNYFYEITQDKSFMTNILKNIKEIESNNKKSDTILAVMSNVLEINCEELLKDREFTEAVFDFIENTYGELSTYDVFFDELAKKMLPTPELASDEELAKRYIKNLKWFYNVDRNLFENKDFMEMALDNGNPVAFDNLELPLKFYYDPNILEKYLEAKSGLVFNGINFDFDNEVFAKLYEQHYNESIETCMREEIARAIERKKAIVVCEYDDSIDYNEIIGIIQQWAEDEDLIRIGDKIKVVNNSEGEIVEGQINIVVGENSKNTITMDSDYNTTIVLDGNKIASILKQIGIDTRIDMEQMQELYSEMIGELKQKSQEGKIMPQEVSEIIKGSNLLNHGQNHINIIVDGESDKVKAVLSIPHPVYRNEFQKVELDGEQLLEIIELANNNSPKELCSDIIQMLPELGPRKKKEQKFVKLVQELATQKSELEAKKQGAKELLEQYEELNGEKNKSLDNE